MKMTEPTFAEYLRYIEEKYPERTAFSTVQKNAVTDISYADFISADVDDGIVRVIFTADIFIGLRDARNTFHKVITLNGININFACVADKTEDRLSLAVYSVNLNAEAAKPFDKALHPSFVCVFINNYNHLFHPG